MYDTHFLTEEYILEDYPDILETCNALGISYTILPNDYYIKHILDPECLYTLIPHNSLVFFHGSFQTARFVTRQTDWYELINYDPLNYRVTTYRQYASSDVFLNRDYVLLPAYEAWARYKYTQPYFIRPNRSDKPFPGQLYSFNNTLTEFIFRNGSSLFVDDLVLISEPKQIKAEYRLLYISGDYVSGSKYAPDITTVIPEDILYMGNYMANEFVNSDLHEAMILDIAALVDGSIKLIEVGSPNVSSWYKMDLYKVLPKLIAHSDTLSSET